MSESVHAIIETVIAMDGILKDILTIFKFLVPLTFQETLLIASQLKSESMPLFVAFGCSILAYMVSLSFAVILFGFRFSVHEEEGPFVRSICRFLNARGPGCHLGVRYKRYRLHIEYE